MVGKGETLGAVKKQRQELDLEEPTALLNQIYLKANQYRRSTTTEMTTENHNENKNNPHAEECIERWRAAQQENLRLPPNPERLRHLLQHDPQEVHQKHLSTSQSRQRHTPGIRGVVLHTIKHVGSLPEETLCACEEQVPKTTWQFILNQ